MIVVYLDKEIWVFERKLFIFYILIYFFIYLFGYLKKGVYGSFFELFGNLGERKRGWFWGVGIKVG